MKNLEDDMLESKSESQNVEFKKNWRDEYLQWVCGFANAQGGTLYVGVDDDGNVVGVEKAKNLAEDIPNKIISLMGIVPDVNILKRSGLEYLEIVVKPSNVAISLNGVYHYRCGATKQELRGTALQQFILKKMGMSWDDIVCKGATLKDIDRKAVAYFLEKAVDAQRLPVGSLRMPTESVLRNLNLVNEEGLLKNAAILLFGKNPGKFFTSVEFKIGRFGKDETDLIFQDLVDGNIIQMTDRVVEILKSKYLISPIHYEGLQRIEPLEIPEDALREAIFNSIVHRDYSGAAIQMKVYADRILLWNEGGLPEGFTMDDLLGEHTSRPRNKNIANAFYRAGFIESWGRGIQKIKAGFENAGLVAPSIQATMGGMMVSILRRENPYVNPHVNPYENPYENASGLDARIISEIQSNARITIQALAEICGKNRDTIRVHLRNMQQKGLVKRVGPDKGGHWEISLDFFCTPK
jgi:ATP-dependent DNA helicase RecG